MYVCTDTVAISIVSTKWNALVAAESLLLIGLSWKDLTWENGQGRYSPMQYHQCVTDLTNLLLPHSWDSAVSIVTGYGLGDREVGDRVPVGSRIFSSPRRPDRL
jgi:hypothetical protein